MHVAHFIQRYPPALGGSEAYFARLSEFMTACGHQVSVHTTNAIDLEAFWSRHGKCLPAGTQTAGGITIHRYRIVRWPGKSLLLKMLSLVPVRSWQCLTLPCNPVSLEMLKCDDKALPPPRLIHASAFPYAWPILCALRLARRLEIPFLLTPFLHLGDHLNPRDRTRRAYLSPPLSYLLSEADRLFVQTRLERSAVLEIGVEEKKITLQGMGVAARECTAGDRVRARGGWNLNDGAPVVGHLANNSEEKGTVDLLRAAEVLWRSGLDFHVVLAGPQMPNFSRFWTRYRFQDRVRRLGVLTETQKRDFFAGLDVFALPSRSDSFGLVLLEAWANGLPNVAYRAGGPAEIVQDRQDGLLADPGDISGLAACLRRLVADRQLAGKLGESGRGRVEREFRWEDKLEIVRRVYEEVAETRKAARLP
jgi:glycosyltransferase involved in cell wall biosynthesis